MAKVISANNIKTTVLTDAEEVTPVRLLIARHYDISSKVNLEFVYDNSETKSITIALGDNVKVSYTDDSGTLQEITGVITDICNKDMATSFKSNTNMGNGNYNLQIKIDASEENDSKVEFIYLINIFDIEPAEIDPGEDTIVSPISWKEESISIKDGLLTIPYNRSEPGTVSLVVSYGEDVVVFREEFEASTVNENATFTWSLRDFSSLNGTSIEGLTYDENGNYIYHNGDNAIEEVKSIDLDDSKIIPAKTALNIDISHFDSLNTESKISTIYTVTEEDVANVTTGYVAPEEPSEPETVKYTVTSTVTNGTVDIESVEVEEGGSSTITFTPDEGYDKVEVTINGTLDDTTIVDGKVIVELTSIAENKDIVVTFDKEVIEPEIVKYTVTSTVTNGTVDIESVEVEENASVSIVATPDEGYDKVEVTINGVVKDTSIVDGKVVAELQSVTENTTIEFVFSKSIINTLTLDNGIATINVTNNTEDDIPVTLNILSEDNSIIYTEENTVSAISNKDFIWNLREYSENATEEELYNIENTNNTIVAAGDYTYELVYTDKTISESISISETDVENAKNDACWIYNEDPYIDGDELAIRYNRLVPGDVELVVKANDGIVFKEQYTFSTTNPQASFTWSMRDFTSLNNTNIQGLHYDENGVYVYHNGDNNFTEVAAIDRDNTKIIPAGTVLDITITRGKSVLTKQYTVTEEDVTALTF